MHSRGVQMTEPKISIIIPCYNMEAYLPQCLDSVLSQTLEDFEAICVDDGSQDQTGLLLDGFHSRDRRIRVIHQENRGVSAARNLGLSLAQGHYIAFLDPDDFYPDNKALSLLYTKALQHDALICGGSFSNYQEPSGKITVCYTGDYAGYSFRKEGFLSYLNYQFDFGFQRFLYRRDFLLENDLYFPPYARYQDPPFFVHAMILAQQFYAVPQPVYRYRIGIQDQAVRWSSSKLQDMIRGHLDVLRLSREHHLPQLHALTVRRFEGDDICLAVRNAIASGEAETLALVRQFQAAIDPAVLPGHILRVLQPEEILPQRSVGRRLRTLLQFCRANGLGRTLLLLRETLTK